MDDLGRDVPRVLTLAAVAILIGVALRLPVGTLVATLIAAYIANRGQM
jgi:hypothetical protein